MSEAPAARLTLNDAGGWQVPGRPPVKFGPNRNGRRNPRYNASS